MALVPASAAPGGAGAGSGPVAPWHIMSLQFVGWVGPYSPGVVWWCRSGDLVGRSLGGCPGGRAVPVPWGGTRLVAQVWCGGRHLDPEVPAPRGCGRDFKKI